MTIHPREEEIVAMLRDGKSGRSVSRALNVNHRTVYKIRDAHGIPNYFADPDGPACRHGHPWPEFRHTCPDGRRECRECKRLAKQRIRKSTASLVDDLAVELVVRGERHQLTALERRAAVRKLLNIDTSLSGTQMADRIGCTPRTIWRIRKQLREAA